MINNEKNIQIVVDLLKYHHIEYIVISPGGTNIALVNQLQKDKSFTCYSVVDERSAVYIAIGIYLRTGKVVALSCTSAQATRNYVPGLTEAFYKKVPILALTMMKHPRFTYQGYMQAPDQASLPKDCVKDSYTLPFISDINDVYHSIRVANEAFLRLKDFDYGPVQLCIPWLDFSKDSEEPQTRCISFVKSPEEIGKNLVGKRIMLIIGEHRVFENALKSKIERFAENYNVAIYVNHLSNYHGKYSIHANLALTTMKKEEFEKQYLPDIIITIGGQTGDYPLFLMLSKEFSKRIEHWDVNIAGKVMDTYDKLSCIFQMSEFDFFDSIAENVAYSHEYYEAWNACLKEKTALIELPFSNAYAAKVLAPVIPANSVIQFSILNSLRIWNLYDLDDTIECFSNVAAFGIDGGLSSLIGQSLVTDNLCFMIIGDLAFYYDMNSIGIRHIKNNLRILLINNNGGIEFKMSGTNNETIDKYIAAAHHFKNAEGWSNTCGFKYLKACTIDEFNMNYQTFIEKSDAPIVFELFISDLDEANAYTSIKVHNMSGEIVYKLKQKVKQLIR